jgi:hypothetical protein
MTTKMYTKLASIEINDEILSKLGGIQNNYFLEFLEKFSRRTQSNRDVYIAIALCSKLLHNGPMDGHVT